MLDRPIDHKENFLQVGDLQPEGRQESPWKARRKSLNLLSFSIFLIEHTSTVIYG